MKKLIVILIFFHLISLNIQAQEYERYKKLTDTTILSKKLGFEKKISVTVPFEWQADLDNNFPLIIIFDSQNQRSRNYILNTIDYLTSNEQMPASILISVESEQQYRYMETAYTQSDPNGKAVENEQFIFNELIPLAEKEYKAGPFRMLIGHSRYGYFTTSLLNSRPDEINAVISLSPFFIQKNVNLVDSVEQLVNTQFSSTKYYRFATGNDFPEDYYKMEAMLKTNENPQFNAGGQLFLQADHNVTPGLAIAQALYEIFEFWSKEQNAYIDNDNKDLKILPELENNIANHYGCELRFALGILNGKGWYFYNEGEFEKAIQAWEILLENYPNLSEAYLYIIDAKKEAKMDYANTVAEFKINLQESALYSDNEKKELLEELPE